MLGVLVVNAEIPGSQQQRMGARRTERWAASLGAWRPGDVASARRRYQDIRRARTEDPRVRAPDSDVSADNPLAHSADSGWGNYFKTAEVRDTIALDLERLHPGDAFYSAPDVQHALLNVLLVWSLENPPLGYRQGMHELASLVFSQRASDAMASDPSGHRWGASTSAPTSASEDARMEHEPELSASYVEHDAYAMFAALMGADSPPNGRGKIRLASFFEDPDGPGKLSGVQMACDRVYVRLQKVDPALRAHLDKVGIEPQLFLLRWLRVLFSREFHLDDAMLIWDAAIGTNDPSSGDDTSFSKDGDIDYNNPGVMDLIESTAVAMLAFVRVDVLSQDDFGQCLRRLQKFPPVEDVLALVERARFASRGKVDADGWIPRAVSSGQTPGGASTPSSSGHTVGTHKQTPGSKANEFLAKAKETGGVARERASALIGRAKNAMGVLKLEDDQGGLRYDMGAGEPFGSSAQPELPGVSGELPGVDLGAVDASRRQPPPPVRPIATTPPTAIPRRLSEDLRSNTPQEWSTPSPTHHLMRPRPTAPGEEGAPAEEGDELRYGEMKSPAWPVFDAPATGYEEILPRDPTPSPTVPQPPPAPAVSALSASGLIDPSPDNRGEALFGTSGSEKNAVKKTGGLFDDDDPSTTGGLFDPSPPRHLSGGNPLVGSLSGRTVGMVSKVRSLFADGDEDEDPLFGGGVGRGRRGLTPNEGVSSIGVSAALVALKDAAGAIEGVLRRGEVRDEAAAGDLREALVKLRSATARLR